MALYTGLILWRLYIRLDSVRYPLKTYADMAERIFGRAARHVVNVLQSLQLLINVDFSPPLVFSSTNSLLGCNDLPQQRPSTLPNRQFQGWPSHAIFNAAILTYRASSSAFLYVS